MGRGADSGGEAADGKIRLGRPRGVDSHVKPAPPLLFWLAPAGALVLPPFLLIPLVRRLAGAQFFKDLYEACLWLSPAVGVITLVAIIRWMRANADARRGPTVVTGLVLATLALASPGFFYVLLAVLAGR